MIPATAHFIWLGKELPYTHLLAIRSAAMRGGFDRVVFHHDSDLSRTAHHDALKSVDSLEWRPLDPARILGQGSELLALFARQRQPAARANILRAAILRSEGGVYLDTDTITVRDLDSLRTRGAFFGVEHVCFPASVKRQRRPGPWVQAYTLTAARDICRRLPDGPRWFRRIAHLYAWAANNAVLGAAPEHPLVEALIDGMLALPAARQGVRYALGTHLLQTVAERFENDPDVTICPPDTFYPLGPEISEHWFRTPQHIPLDEVITDETRVVHWYASVRTKNIVPRIDAAYVRRNASVQLLSALAEPFA